MRAIRRPHTEGIRCRVVRYGEIRQAGPDIRVVGLRVASGSTGPLPGQQAEGQREVTSPEATIDEINREFPDAEVFARNGMCYAKLTGIIVIAAAPDTRELREQIRGYFERTCRRDGNEVAGC
jgi:hypothetical protein